MSRDIWQYISMEYVKQTVNYGEIGSVLAAKLPISRLQRNLKNWRSWLSAFRL